MRPEDRVRVTLLAGPAAAGRHHWMQAALAARPADETWGCLLSAGSAPVIAASDRVFVETLAGCPCCTGAAALRVALVRCLRHFKPQRILVDLPGYPHRPPGAHLARDPWLAPLLHLESLLILDGQRALLDPAEVLTTAMTACDRIEWAGDVSAAARDRIEALRSPQLS